MFFLTEHLVFYLKNEEFCYIFLLTNYCSIVLSSVLGIFYLIQQFTSAYYSRHKKLAKSWRISRSSTSIRYSFYFVIRRYPVSTEIFPDQKPTQNEYWKVCTESLNCGESTTVVNISSLENYEPTKEKFYSYIERFENYAAVKNVSTTKNTQLHRYFDFS